MLSKAAYCLSIQRLTKAMALVDVCQLVLCCHALVCPLCSATPPAHVHMLMLMLTCTYPFTPRCCGIPSDAIAAMTATSLCFHDKSYSMNHLGGYISIDVGLAGLLATFKVGVADWCSVSSLTREGGREEGGVCCALGWCWAHAFPLQCYQAQAYVCHTAVYCYCMRKWMSCCRPVYRQCSPPRLGDDVVVIAGLDRPTIEHDCSCPSGRVRYRLQIEVSSVVCSHCAHASQAS